MSDNTITVTTTATYHPQRHGLRWYVQDHPQYDGARAREEWAAASEYDDPEFKALAAAMVAYIDAHSQPDEPTEFGARVEVGGVEFLRAGTKPDYHSPWTVAESIGGRWWFEWSDITARGPVTVKP